MSEISGHECKVCKIWINHNTRTFTQLFSQPCNASFNCFCFFTNQNDSFPYPFTAGLQSAFRARGTEPHTHGIWSTSFRLVVTWFTERTYASADCTGGVGETIKRKGGVSQACLGKSTSFIYHIHNMVNCRSWQLSKQDTHWPVAHDHIAGLRVNSSRWRDLFESCPLTS